MKENIMSEEAFNELIDGFEYVNNLTDYGRKNIKYHVQKLQQENRQLNEEYTKVQKMYEDTFRDYQQLKDNWDKLKEDLKNNIKYWKEQEKEWIKLGFIKSGGEANNKIIFEKILNKMEELKGSDSNVKD